MQALESIKDLFMHINSSKLHFGHIWLTYFGCVSGFLRHCHTFLDETLSQNVAHINDLILLGNTQVVLGILSSCVTC